MGAGEARGKLTVAGDAPALAILTALAVPVAKKYAWSWLRTFLIQKAGFRAEDFLTQGPGAEVSIDYSQMPPVDTIPPVRIDPAALGKGGDP